jgi:hypothetical protein
VTESPAYVPPTSELTTESEATPAEPPVEPRQARRLARGDAIAAAVVVAAFIAFAVATRRAIGEPLWYDEQWRAYFVSVHDHWWSEISHSNAPMSLAWYVGERLAIATRGNQESTLRFANIVWVGVAGLGCYALARRWMHAVAALLLAILAMLNALLVVYALQLKPFVADAAGTLLAVAALLYAADATTTRRRIGAFAVACFGLLLATPAVFVVVPMLLFLAYEAWFRRRDRVMLWGSIVTLVIAAVHLRVFVMRQNALTKIDYWNANFVPHSGIADATHFTWDQTRAWIPGFVTAAYQPHSAHLFPLALTHTWSTTLKLTITALLVLGIWHAATRRDGRIMLLGIACAFPLTLVASWKRWWPFGFVRTNLYIVPLLYLLCALGMVRLWMLARRSTVAARRARRPLSRAGATLGMVACGAGLVAGAAGAVMSASVSVGAARAALPTKPPTGYGRNLDSAVAAVRARADASTAAIVAGTMAWRGWQYYMFQRSDMSGTAVPPARTDLVATHGTAQPAEFLARHPEVRSVYYYAPLGTSGTDVHADEGVLRTARFCVRQQWPVPASGLLVRLAPCSAP